MSFADEQVTKTGLSPDVAGPHIGPYTLIREIGSGGMGTVYLAVRNDEFRQRVALKVLKRGMDTDTIVRRFRNERQILASLEHPFIARLLDGGTTPDGLPYFAMEYVEGQRIVAYCDALGLDTNARIELFRKVCSAVQYAHQNLIIHRDIKPANVLVTWDGTPKLLDFGVAKLLNAELAGETVAATVIGAQMMTPDYASPEQVRGEAATTATDVYSLGMLLYELLTGRRPYRLDSRTPAEIARVVCDSVPVPPSTAVTQVLHAPEAGSAIVPETPTGPPSEKAAAGMERLRRRLAGDLDTIVLKALAKEPLRRYASVDQFSEDLHRHMAGLPVMARRDTFGYRATKFVRRNRLAVIAAALVFLALIAGIVGTTWQARAARRERVRAEQRFNDVRQLANAFLFEVHDAIEDLPGSTPARRALVSKGLEYLDKLARDAGGMPDLQRELAMAYVKVGDVQGRPLTPNLGDTAGALASYRKATALYEALASGSVADAATQRGRATVDLRLSEVLASSGDTAEALSHAQKALTIQRQIAELAAADDSAVPIELRRDLVVSYTRVADLLSATGDTKSSLDHRRTALALMESIATTAPDDVANAGQLAIAYQKLGNSLGNPNYPNIGDPEGALVQLEKSVGIYRELTAAHPTNATLGRNMAVANSNTADVLLALNRREEALARQREAQAEFLALAEADPSNVAARNDVAIGLSKIAEMLDAEGRTAEAVRELQTATAIHLKLAAADPSNSGWKLALASDYNRLATVQAKRGDRAAAIENHTKAVEMTRELRDANPENVELSVAVALARLGRGDAYAAFGRRARGVPRETDLATAERDYLAGTAVLEGLLQKKAIEGTDVKTLEAAREELARIRADRAGAR
ncbi:MAG TPA: protein kinase [Vicinamibacterales bacterium]|nr:protein kinase [Vicinamibacterales bacterium]